MVVLMSREFHPTQSIPKSLPNCSTPEPLTPAPMDEPSIQSPSSSQSNRRRSLRLASPLVSGDNCDQNGPSKRKRAADEARNPNSKAPVDDDSSEILGLRSGKRIVEKVSGCSDGKSVVDVEIVKCESDKAVIVIEEDLEEKVSITEEIESNPKIGGNVNGIEETSSLVSPVDNKLKGKLQADDNGDSIGKETSKIDVVTNRSNEAESSRRYSRDDKGKGKLVDGDSSIENWNKTLLELLSQLEYLRTKRDALVNDPSRNVNQANNSNSRKIETRRDVFKDIARKNASRFAHFEPQEQQRNNSSPNVDVEIPAAEESEKIEDWPGPFSTAMKIIRDRENKLKLWQGASTLHKSVPITWIPRKNQGSVLSRARVPSLLDLSMNVLVKNVDAVTSLDHVPDALRHRLCQLLSDCRGMKGGFLELLLCGSPTEIRIKDCSWLTEEEFTKCFGACDTSNLSVLQLDQGGRCIVDYLLPDTLARSSRSMPALITLSLNGACRLTDTGLGSLLSSAPALRSINLSQCSLLTSVGIDTLAQSLGSHLQELYIDDCQNLDAMLILPALKKLEHLEVLSVAGNQSVCDKFVREFASACGHSLKEFVLANCTNLTDSSVKVIAETCPSLCALDLEKLSKLTDATLGYLANSCQKIQTLKFCRNTFSDQAIAAFLETSGEPLKELSLNNITKVGNNAALAVARKSRNLVKLDLSWCRNLTDEAVGLIVDSCSSLRLLKLFGCGQITNVLQDGHSNENVEIIGLKLSPILEHIRVPDSQDFPLRYSYTTASSFCN